MLRRISIVSLVAFGSLSGVVPSTLLVGLLLLPTVVCVLTLLHYPSLKLTAMFALLVGTFWISSVWLSTLAGGLVNEFPDETIVAAQRLTGSWIMLVLGIFLIRGNIAFLLLSVGSFAALHAGIATLQWLTGSALNIGGQLRATGLLTANVLANTLGFGFLCVIGLQLQLVRNNFSRSRLAFLAALIGLGLIASGTLKNIIIVFIIFGCLYLYQNLNRRPIKVMAAGGILLLLMPFVIASERLGQRIIASFGMVFSRFGFNVSDIPDVGGSMSLIWRIEHWERLFYDWTDRFFFFGSGIGQSRNMRGTGYDYGRDANAHSDWVALIVEGGIVFSTIWIACAVVLLLLALKGARARGEFVFLIIVSAYFYGSMIFGNVLYTIPYLYFYWIFLGAYSSEASNWAVSKRSRFDDRFQAGSARP